MEKRWLDTDEAAEYTRLAKGTLYNLVSRKEITHVKKGRRIIFDIHILDAFMEKDTVFARESRQKRSVMSPPGLKFVKWGIFDP